MRRAATSLLLILAIALGLRLAYFRYEVQTIPRQALQAVPFLYEPGDIAYSLAIGKGFSSPFRADTGPTAWTTPIYPLLVAGVFELFGTFSFSAFVAAVLLNILFSTLTCVPLFYIGKRIGGIALGAAAAWLWAVFPNAVIIPFQWIWDTSLSGLLAATLVLATLAVAESSRIRDWCGYGLLWGIALMTNATLLAGLPFSLGWMAWRLHKRDNRWIAQTAVAAGAIVLCCVPWTARNFAVFHHFIPLRSPLGLQLWLGNNDQVRDDFSGWLHPIDNIAERAKYVRMGEVAYMNEKQREAIHWMISHPGREAVLFKDRLIATWAGTPHPLRDFARAPLLIRIVFVSNWLATAAMLLGIAVFYSDPRLKICAVPVTAFPIVYPFAAYLSQALLRYRYPIDPMVLVLAATGAVWLNQRHVKSDEAEKGVGHCTLGSETFLRVWTSLFLYSFGNDSTRVTRCWETRAYIVQAL